MAWNAYPLCTPQPDHYDTVSFIVRHSSSALGPCTRSVFIRHPQTPFASLGKGSGLAGFSGGEKTRRNNP